MPSLFYFDKTGQEVEFVFAPESGEVSIGRSSGNTLRIRAPSISRSHAVLQAADGQYVLVDGGSSNGTYINGKRLVPNRPYPVSVGDALRFGEVEVRFTEGAAAPSLGAAFAAPPLPAPPMAPPAAGPAAGPPPPFGAPPRAPAQAAPPMAGPPPLGGPTPEQPTARPSLGGSFDLSHMLDPPPAAPVASPPPADPLAGLFDGLSLGEPPAPAAAAAPQPKAGPALPRPGEGPIEINLDDLLGDMPEGEVAPEPSAAPAVAAPEPAPAPVLPAAVPPAAALADMADLLAGFSASLAEANAEDDEPAIALDITASGERGAISDSGELPGLSAEPPRSEPEADAAERDKLVQELKEELEARRRKIEGLQKAARRDVEAKKKLQDEKTDLEVQVAALQEELQLQANRQSEELARLRHEMTENADEAHREELMRLQARVAELEELLAETTAEAERQAGLLEEVGRESGAVEEELLAQRAAVAQLEAGQAELRRELEQAVSERDSLIGRVEELDLALMERPSGEELLRTSGEVKALKDELEEQRESSSRRIADYLAHIDMLVGEKSELEAQVAEAEGLRAELDTARSELELLEQRLAGLPDPDEVAELELEVLELRRSSDESERLLRDLDERLAQANDTLEQVEARGQEFKDRARQTFEDLAAEMAAIEEELERCRGELAQSEDQAAELERQVRSLDSDLSRKEGELERSQQKIQDQLERIEALKAAGVEALAEIDELRGLLDERPLPEDLAAKAQQVLLLEERLAGLEEELGQRDQDLRGELKKARNQREELDAARAAQAELEAELEAARGAQQRVARLEGELQALREELELRPQATDLEALRAQLAEAEELHGQTEADLDTLRNKLRSRDEDLAQLRSQAGDVGVLGGEVAELKAQNERLRAELTAASADLEQADQARAELQTLLGEVQRRVAEQSVELEELRAGGAAGGVDPSALRELEAALAQAQGQIAAQAEQAAALEARLAAGGGAAPAGDTDVAGLRELLQKVNDTVSGWRNNFMYVGNYLLDLQNGLALLRGAGAPEQQGAALKEIETAGNIEEMQELLRACEDDSRRIKREMLRFRDFLDG